MRLSRHLVALLCSIILPTCLPYILSPSHSLSRPLSISLQSTPVSSALTVISSALTKSLPPVPPSIHQHVVTSTLTVSYTQPLRPALPTATIHFFPGYLVSAWPIFFTDYLSKLATQTNSIIVTYHTSNFGLNHTSITAEITTVLTDAADITSRLKYLQHFYSSRDDVHVQTSPDIDPPKDVPYIVPHGQYHPVPTAATKPPAVHYIGHSLGCKILTLLLTKPHAVPTSVSYLSPNNADLLTSQITLISKLVARLNTNINLTLLTTLLTTLSGTISFQFQPPPNSVYDMLPGLFGRNGRYRDRTMFAVCDKNDEAGLDMALEFIEAVGGEGEVKGGIEGRGEEQRCVWPFLRSPVNQQAGDNTDGDNTPPPPKLRVEDCGVGHLGACFVTADRVKERLNIPENFKDAVDAQGAKVEFGKLEDVDKVVDVLARFILEKTT